MKLKIKDKEFELHYSLRMYLNYESLVGHSVEQQGEQTYTELINLFYCSVTSSIQYHKLDITITFDEFVDYLDEHMETISEFSKWFIENVGYQSQLTKKEKEEPKSKKSKNK